MTLTDRKIDEYISLGLETGLFEKSQKDTIRSRVANVEIREIKGSTVPTYNACSTVDGNRLLIVNTDKCSPIEADEDIFRELSTLVNDIHRDLYVYNNSRIIEFKDRYKDYFVGNPLLRYPEWGMILLDKVISEYTAKVLVDKKYDLGGEDLEEYSSKYLDNPKDQYYLANKFSKTIYSGKNSLKKLCIAAYRDCAVDTILCKYGDRENGMYKLYEILANMGNVALSNHKGRVPDSFINTEESNIENSIKYIKGIKMD